MSHATADLEYFQCDMCQTYMHRDIYCNHRRECKGKDSQEIKKADVLRISRDLDDETRLRSKQVAAGGTSADICGADPSAPVSRFAAAPKAILTTTNLDKAQRQQGLRVLRGLESTSVATAMARVGPADAAPSSSSCSGAASAAAGTADGKKPMTCDDIDDFLNS